MVVGEIDNHAIAKAYAGWAPVYVSNLTEDIPGYIEAPANALAYSWKHFIGGHLGRLGTRTSRPRILVA